MFIIDETGHTRYLGNRVPMKAASEKDWTVYGDTPQTPLILRSRWDQLISLYSPDDPAHPKRPPVHDQDGVGQCNADATAALAEFTMNVQGVEPVPLSAADLYDRINGGSDNGSLLEDAMREMLNNGIGTAATCGTLWKRGEFRGPAPAAERAKYKVSEAYLCPTFDHVFSAVLSGFGIVSGILWFDNFTPDRSGWLPLSGSGRYGGHAVFGYKPTKRNGTYGIWHQNSWTTAFGISGACVFPETLYNGPVGGWWAVRQMTDGGGSVPAPNFPALAV